MLRTHSLEVRFTAAFKRRLSVAALAIEVLGPATSVSASEQGLSHYANGVNTVYNGILPAPGDLQFYNYSQYYDADSFKGSSGSTLIKDFHASVAVDAPRLIYTYPVDLGPFHISSGIVPIIARFDVKAEGVRGVKTGLADIDLEPLYVSVSNRSHTFFAYFGPDIWLKTGSYDKNNPVNLGQNYATIAPGVHTTWLPSERFEWSTSMVTEFNTTNKATHYHSGTAINFDSAVIVRPFKAVPRLRVAIQGFVHQQLENDTVSGQRYLDGFKGRAFALGPQVEYSVGKHGGVLLKYDREFDVENRPRGNKFWLEFTSRI